MNHIFNIIILCSVLCFGYYYGLGGEIDIAMLIAFIVFSTSSYFVFRYTLYCVAVAEVEEWKARKLKVMSAAAQVEEAYPVTDELMKYRKKRTGDNKRKGGLVNGK